MERDKCKACGGDLLPGFHEWWDTLCYDCNRKPQDTPKKVCDWCKGWGPDATCGEPIGEHLCDGCYALLAKQNAEQEEEDFWRR